MRKRSLLIVPLLVFFVLTLPALPATLVRSSHTGAIAEMVVAADGNLFTAGSDGKVKIWDLSDERLIQEIQVDRLPVQRMAVYPDQKRIAVYSGNERSHRISTWDWESGEQQFVRSLDEEVVEFGVSPAGSYVYYTNSRLESIHILDGRTGRELPFLRRATGIVSWAMVGSSEKRIVTYVRATGRLSYYDVVTGAAVGVFSAPPDLTIYSLLDQRRYAAAVDGEGLIVVLDLLSGTIADSVPAGSVQYLTIDRSTGDIIVLTSDFGGRDTIQRYGFSDGELRQKYEIRRTIPEDTRKLLVAGREIIGTGLDGTIYRWPSFSDTPSEIARPFLIPIRDAALAGNRIHLLTDDRVLSITSDYFDQPTNAEGTTYVRDRNVVAQIGPRGRFVEKDDLNLYLWTPDFPGAAVSRYRFYGATLPLDFDLPGVPRYLTADQDDLLMISGTGLLTLLSDAGDQLFSYHSVGMQAAITTPRGIFVGKSMQGSFDSSLLRLSPSTGETVPLANAAKLVFEIVFDRRRGRLFTLGVQDEPNQNALSTILQIHQGPNMERTRTVLEVPGEHLDSHVLVDETTGDVYTTLDDRGGILRWDGLRVSELLRNTAHVPLRLRLAGELLIVTNTDGTLSVYERATRKPLFDLVVVASPTGRQEWIAVLPDGAFFTLYDDVASSSYVSVSGSKRLQLLEP